MVRLATGRERKMHRSLMEEWDDVLELVTQPLPSSSAVAAASSPSRSRRGRSRRKAGGAVAGGGSEGGARRGSLAGGVSENAAEELAKLRDRMGGIQNAWQELAQAEMAEREKMGQQLARMQHELEESEANRQRAEKIIARMEVTQEAWREAAQATDLDATAATRQAEARVGVKLETLNKKAEATARDNAQLSGQLAAYKVAEVVVMREIATLDGLLGFTNLELQSSRDEVRRLLLTLDGQREQLNEARTELMQARLQVQHLQNVVTAQKRSLEEQRHQTAGAQVWARDVVDKFENTTSLLRQAAGEELEVQAKRMRVWEEKLESLSTMGVGSRGNKADENANFVREVRELVEQERQLLATQLSLLRSAHDVDRDLQLATLQEKAATQEASLEAAQHTEIDFDALAQAGSCSHRWERRSVTSPLHGRATWPLHRRAIRPLHGRYMVVTFSFVTCSLHGRYMFVTWSLHGRYIDVTRLLHDHHAVTQTAATHQHLDYTAVTRP